MKVSINYEVKLGEPEWARKPKSPDTSWKTFVTTCAEAAAWCATVGNMKGTLAFGIDSKGTWAVDDFGIDNEDYQHYGWVTYEVLDNMSVTITP